MCADSARALPPRMPARRMGVRVVAVRPMGELVSQPSTRVRLGLPAAMGVVAAGLATMEGVWAWTVPWPLVTNAIGAALLMLFVHAAFRGLVAA